MRSFLIISTVDYSKIFPHLFQAKISDRVHLFYDIGEFFDKKYLYTGNSLKSIRNRQFKERFPDSTSPNKLFEISDDFCFLYPSNPGQYILMTDRHGKVPIFFQESEGGFTITTDLCSYFKNDFELLDPSKFLSINTVNDILEIKEKSPIVAASTRFSRPEFINHLARESESSIKNAIKSYNKIGILYSGGVDSSVLAQILKKNQISFTGYVVGSNNSPDIISAQKAAKLLNIDLKVILIDETTLEQNLEEIESIIQTRLFSTTTSTVPRVVSLEVASVLYFGIKTASLDGCDVVLSAIGTEEMFVGFSLEDRHLDRSKPLLNVVQDKMFSIYTRDMYRNYRLAAHFDIDVKTPFVSTELFQIALAIPLDLKVHNQVKKYIWRQTGINLGLPPEIAFRKNKATQFGSASSKLFARLAKSRGYKYKRDFITDYIK